jgi:hypothetical protein
LVGLFGFVGLLDGGPVRFVGSTTVVVDVGPGVVGCPVRAWRPVVEGAVATVDQLGTLLAVEVGVVVAEPTAPPVRQSLTAGACVQSVPRLVGIKPDESGCSRQRLPSGHHTTTATMSATTAMGRATATLRRRLAARSLALLSARMAYQGRRNGQVVRSVSGPIA